MEVLTELAVFRCQLELNRPNATTRILFDLLRLHSRSLSKNDIVEAKNAHSINLPTIHSALYFSTQLE